MQEGSTVRNVVVVLGYIFLFPIWLPLLFVALPFIAAYKVYTGAWSEKLSKLPGIEPGGGAVPALAAFAYVFVALAVVGAATGGGGGGEPTDGSSAALDGTPTAQERQTATATQVNQNQNQGGGNDATATATPEPTASPSPTQSPSPTASPTPEPSVDLKIVVEYSGEWQGALSYTISGESKSKSISGSGTTTIDVPDDAVIVSANAQKQTANSEKLTIKIVRGDEELTSASTTADYGVAQVSKSFY